MFKVNSRNIRFTVVDLWLLDKLTHYKVVQLSSLVHEYSKEKGINERNARRVLERRLRRLEFYKIVERISSQPVTYKLSGYSIPSDPLFDLRNRENSIDTPVVHNHSTISGISDFKSQLRELGIGTISNVNEYRQKALEIAENKFEIPSETEAFIEISKLFKENLDYYSNSVLLFKKNVLDGSEEENEDDYFYVPYPSRFTNKRIAYRNYKNAKQALMNGFSRHKDAIMLTLTLPRVFELVYPIECCGTKFEIPLQYMILSELKTRVIKLIRQMWKGTKIEIFSDPEFHGDYASHVHVILFGIPYIIDWNRKVGKKKEDALTYYARKYNVKIPPDADKTQVSKFVLTAIIDYVLTNILVKYDRILGTNLLERYLEFKKVHNLQGPINEVHRIREGKWVDIPPDAVRSTGVVSPLKYVMKYVTKVLRMVVNKEEIPEKHKAKIIGYWLLGKRFNSYSPSLRPKNGQELGEEYEIGTGEPKWKFLGVFDELEAQLIIEMLQDVESTVS